MNKVGSCISLICLIAIASNAEGETILVINTTTAEFTDLILAVDDELVVRNGEQGNTTKATFFGGLTNNGSILTRKQFAGGISGPVTLEVQGGSFINNGTLVTTTDIPGNGGDGTFIKGLLTNTGEFDVLTTTTIDSTDSTGLHANAGIIRLRSTLNVINTQNPLSLFNVSSGFIAGAGTLNVSGGYLDNSGSITYDSLPGLPTITNGDLVMGRGGFMFATLNFKIGNATAGANFDTQASLIVQGDVSLVSATLNVVPNGNLPEAGDVFRVIDSSGTVQGSFFREPNNVFVGGLNLVFNTIYSPTAVDIEFVSATGLLGDYDNNGTVNSAGLGVWQSTFGTSAEFSGFFKPLDLRADGNFNGVIDGGDFLVWQRNFGSSNSVSSSQAIPEPSSCILICSLTVGVLLRRNRT